MLQKMSQQKNKKDLQIEDLLNKNNQSEQVVEEKEDKPEFSLGQGIGKHGQGILNPIKVELRPAQGGIGYAQKPAHSGGKKRRGKQAAEELLEAEENAADEIDMDIHDKAGEKKRDEQAKEQK